MLWVLYSLVSAFFLALSDATVKKALTEENERLMAWLRLLFSLPLLVLVFILIDKPAVDFRFWRSFAIALPLETLAMLLYIKAIRSSPLSLTLPFLALTPLFLILFSYLIVGERVSPAGVLGIGLLVAGSYTLNIHHFRQGALEPLRAVFREKGSRLMIIVALIYSLTSSLGKMAIIHSSALYFASTYYMALTAALLPFAFFGKKKKRPDGREIKYAAISGVILALMVVFHMLGMSLGKVAYMIAVKRTSVLFGVLLGYLFFSEPHARQRFLGASLMFAGIILLGLAN